MDAATLNERRSTVAIRYAGTCSLCDEHECRRWRPGRSKTRTSWYRFSDWCVHWQPVLSRTLNPAWPFTVAICY